MFQAKALAKLIEKMDFELMPNGFWILLDQMIMDIQIQIDPIQVHPKQLESIWTSYYPNSLPPLL